MTGKDQEMECDTKQKVLFAFYAEYQKDIPNMDEITPEELGIDPTAFWIAVEKLENEGYISGSGVRRVGNELAISIVNTVMMTRDGLAYVENKLSISATLSGKEKVKKMGEVALAWGWEQFKDFSAKVLAEMVKNKI